MSKFHIEDDWYLVPDDYSWNLARKGNATRKKHEWAEITYYHDPESALNAYIAIRQRRTAGNAGDGTIKDLVDILYAENKRLSELLKNAFSEVCEWKEGD